MSDGFVHPSERRPEHGNGDFPFERSPHYVGGHDGPHHGPPPPVHGHPHHDPPEHGGPPVYIDGGYLQNKPEPSPGEFPNKNTELLLQIEPTLGGWGLKAKLGGSPLANVEKGGFGKSGDPDLELSRPNNGPSNGLAFLDMGGYGREGNNERPRPFHDGAFANVERGGFGREGHHEGQGRPQGQVPFVDVEGGGYARQGGEPDFFGRDGFPEHHGPPRHRGSGNHDPFGEYGNVMNHGFGKSQSQEWGDFEGRRENHRYPQFGREKYSGESNIGHFGEPHIQVDMPVRGYGDLRGPDMLPEPGIFPLVFNGGGAVLSGGGGGRAVGRSSGRASRPGRSGTQPDEQTKTTTTSTTTSTTGKYIPYFNKIS